MNNKPKNLAVFASGRGSNARAICEYASKSPYFNVRLIATNKSTAGVLELAEEYVIPSFVFNREELENGEAILSMLSKSNIDFIALAGFLKKIPRYLISEYPKKIVNIHPALLPKYGGKGMYGRYIHQAVIENKEYASGITIHYVSEEYDEGAVIFQCKCPVKESDDASVLASRVLRLEHHYFPIVIEGLAKSLV